MAAFDSDAFDSTNAFHTDAFDFSSTSSDDDADWRLRDAVHGRRFSWGVGCVLLLLMAGCIQPPRVEVYNPPCLRQDTGQVTPPCR